MMSSPTVRAINALLHHVGLHISRDSSFKGLRLTLARTEELLAKTRVELLQSHKEVASLQEMLAVREQERLLSLSKTRWQDDEPDTGLTWGVQMLGDAFVDFMLDRTRLTDMS